VSSDSDFLRRLLLHNEGSGPFICWNSRQGFLDERREGIDEADVSLEVIEMSKSFEDRGLEMSLILMQYCSSDVNQSCL
jgi:hypothetical protein